MINTIQTVRKKNRSVANNILAKDASENVSHKRVWQCLKQMRIGHRYTGIKVTLWYVFFFKKPNRELMKMSLNQLEDIYCDPETGYSGIYDLNRTSNKPSKFVKEWLKRQKVYTLHEPMRHKLKPRRVSGSKIADVWQADFSRHSTV